MEMMPFKFSAVIAATFVTLVIGFIWYSPKVFGTIWMRETGITEEKAKQANMIKVFGLTIIYSFLLAFMMPSLVIHQMGPIGMVGGDPTKGSATFVAFMDEYKDAFRSFKHGALHGFIAGVFIALPVTAINALFEQKSWKYILINAGYWMVSMMVMGAIVCGWR